MNDEMIRRRAYEIWEGEGRPAGAELRHWDQAAREMVAAIEAALATPATQGAVDKLKKAAAKTSRGKAPQRRKRADAPA